MIVDDQPAALQSTVCLELYVDMTSTRICMLSILEEILTLELEKNSYDMFYPTIYMKYDLTKYMKYDLTKYMKYGLAPIYKFGLYYIPIMTNVEYVFMVNEIIAIYWLSALRSYISQHYEVI